MPSAEHNEQDAAPPEAAADLPVRLDTQGRIDVDVSCASCGYNLRGVSPALNCPECGRGISHSILHQRLCFAEPGWLDLVRDGLDIMLLARGIVVVSFGVCLLFVPAGFFLPLWIAAMMNFTGVMLVVGREPDSVDDSDRMRRIAAIGAAIPPLGYPVVFAVGYMSDPSMALFAIVGAVAVCLHLAGLMALTSYGGRLAKRLPSPSLTIQCGALTALIGLAGLLLALALLAALSWPLFNLTADPVWDVLSTATLGSAILFLALAWLWGFGLLIQVRRALRRIRPAGVSERSQTSDSADEFNVRH